MSTLQECETSYLELISEVNEGEYEETTDNSED
jgi:hypothetical protein